MKRICTHRGCRYPRDTNVTLCRGHMHMALQIARAQLSAHGFISEREEQRIAERLEKAYPEGWKLGASEDQITRESKLAAWLTRPRSTEGAVKP